MAMQMQRAFNARFLVALTRYTEAAGTYDDNNDYVPGSTVSTSLYGRVTAGNKFSQFEEGMAIHNEDGGIRVSDYRALYITNKYEISLGDKIEYKGIYYNVLQQSDEDQYGFHSYLLEKSENWSPA